MAKADAYLGWTVEDFPSSNDALDAVKMTKDGRVLKTWFDPTDLTRDEAVHRAVLSAAVNDYERAAGKKFDAADGDVPADAVDAYDEVLALREKSRSMGRRRLATRAAKEG